MFTDEELSVLKRMCANGNFPINGSGIAPLIARLEAAEKLIEACGQDLNVSKPYKKWLKAKGVEG